MPCPSGMSVTGGGVTVTSDDMAVSINSSGPYDDDDAEDAPNDGWLAYVNNASATGTDFGIYAICTPGTSVSY